MPAYLIFNEKIHDIAGFEAYRQKTGPLVARLGGRFLVRGGSITPLEGEADFHRLVVIEFNDADAARRFYDCDEYRPLIALRQAASTGYAVLVEGHTAPA